MAILAIKGFRAAAEVLGVVRDVEVDDRGLHVLGLSLVESQQVLTALAANALPTVQMDDNARVIFELFRGQQRQVRQPITAQPAGMPARPAAEPEVANVRTVQAAPAAPSVQVASVVEPVAPPSAGVVEAAVIETPSEIVPAEVPAASAPAPVPAQATAPASPPPPPPPAAPEAAAVPANGVAGLPAEFVKQLGEQEKLRDIIGMISERDGYNTQDAIVRACVELKVVLPVLSRVGNLESRVRRVAEGMGINA